MGIGAVADQGAKGGEDQGQGEHDANQGGGHVQLDDHHAIEGPHQQHQGHADRDLKQGEPQETPEGEIRRGDISKGEKTRAKRNPRCHQFEPEALQSGANLNNKNGSEEGTPDPLAYLSRESGDDQPPQNLAIQVVWLRTE